MTRACAPSLQDTHNSWDGILREGGKNLRCRPNPGPGHALGYSRVLGKPFRYRHRERKAEQIGRDLESLAAPRAATAKRGARLGGTGEVTRSASSAAGSRGNPCRGRAELSASEFTARRRESRLAIASLSLNVTPHLERIRRLVTCDRVCNLGPRICSLAWPIHSEDLRRYPFRGRLPLIVDRSRAARNAYLSRRELSE